MRGHPLAVVAPRLGALHGAEGNEELVQIADRGEVHGGGIRRRGQRRQERVERGAGLGFDRVEHLGGHDEAPRQVAVGLAVHVLGRFRAVIAQAPVHDALQRLPVAGEPPDRVEGLRERQQPLPGDQTVGRPQTPQALVRSRHAHRPRGVGGQADLGLAGGDGGCRTARGSARQRARERPVGRGAVVHVVAGDAVRELVGAGDAAQRRTTAQQVGHRGRGRGLGAGSGQERRVAGADAVALDGEEVLDRDREPGEWALPRALPERIADRAPHRAVKRLRAGCDLRGGEGLEQVGRHGVGAGRLSHAPPRRSRTRGCGHARRTRCPRPARCRSRSPRSNRRRPGAPAHPTGPRSGSAPTGRTCASPR